jgi:hypothetical protein
MRCSAPRLPHRSRGRARGRLARCHPRRKGSRENGAYQHTQGAGADSGHRSRLSARSAGRGVGLSQTASASGIGQRPSSGSGCPRLGVYRTVIRDKSNIYKNNRQCRLMPGWRPRRLGLRAHLPHRAGGSGEEQSGCVTPVAGVRSLPQDDKLSANVALTRSKSGNPWVSLISDALISTRTGSWIEWQVT